MIFKNDLEKSVILSVTLSNLNNLRHFFQERTVWGNDQEDALVCIVKATKCFENQKEPKVLNAYFLAVSEGLPLEGYSILFMKEVLELMGIEKINILNQALEKKEPSVEIAKLIGGMMDSVPRTGTVHSCFC